MILVNLRCCLQIISFSGVKTILCLIVKFARADLQSWTKIVPVIPHYNTDNILFLYYQFVNIKVKLNTCYSTLVVGERVGDDSKIMMKYLVSIDTTCFLSGVATVCIRKGN